MKYLILAPDNRVLYISDDLSYQSNGNYLIYGGTLAIPPQICSMVQVESIPAGVEPEKYMYVNGEFVLNPYWVDAEPDVGMTPDEIMAALDGEEENDNV